MASYGDNGDCPLTIQIYHMSAVKPDARTPAKDSKDSKDSKGTKGLKTDQQTSVIP